MTESSKVRKLKWTLKCTKQLFVSTCWKISLKNDNFLQADQLLWHTKNKAEQVTKSSKMEIRIWFLPTPDHKCDNSTQKSFRLEQESWHSRTRQPSFQSTITFIRRTCAMFQTSILQRSQRVDMWNFVLFSTHFFWSKRSGRFLIAYVAKFSFFTSVQYLTG